MLHQCFAALGKIELERLLHGLLLELECSHAHAQGGAWQEQIGMKGVLLRGAAVELRNVDGHRRLVVGGHSAKCPPTTGWLVLIGAGSLCILGTADDPAP